jgi:hypothetical protein
MGVTVNAIGPAGLTRITASIPGAGDAFEPDDLGPDEYHPIDPAGSSPLAAWLVSDDAHYVTGQVIRCLDDRTIWMKGPGTGVRTELMAPQPLRQGDQGRPARARGVTIGCPAKSAELSYRGLSKVAEMGLFRRVIKEVRQIWTPSDAVRSGNSGPGHQGPGGGDQFPRRHR